MVEWWRMIYLVNGKGAGPKACKNWFLLKHFKEKFSISNHRISVNLLLYDIAPCARIASEQFPLFILLLILYFMVHIRPQWANWQIQKCFIDLNFEISNCPSLKGKKLNGNDKRSQIDDQKCWSTRSRIRPVQIYKLEKRELRVRDLPPCSEGAKRVRRMWAFILQWVLAELVED